MENEVDAAGAVYAVPWFREAMEQASALTGTGIDAQTALLIAAALPIALRVLQLVSPYVDTHNKDIRDTIDIAKTEQLAALYEKHGPEAYAAAIDAAERQAKAAASLRAAGVKK